MSNLLIPVTLDRANRRKDKSVSITFITSLEQTSEQYMVIDNVLDSSGTLYFKSSGNISKEEKESLDEAKIHEPVKNKSQSKRLRNVLYVNWEQSNVSNVKNSTYLSFENYYNNEMERIIQHYKDKLD